MLGTIRWAGVLLGAALSPAALWAQTSFPILRYQATCLPRAPDMCNPGFYVTNPATGVVFGPSYNVYPSFPPFNGHLPGPMGEAIMNGWCGSQKPRGPAYGPPGPGSGQGPGYGPGPGAPRHGAPGYGAPGYGVPGYGAPGYGVPGYGVPGYGAPGYGAPGYGAPGYGAPGYGAPGYGAPGYGAPGFHPDPRLGQGFGPGPYPGFHPDPRLGQGPWGPHGTFGPGGFGPGGPGVGPQNPGYAMQPPGYADLPSPGYVPNLPSPGYVPNLPSPGYVPNLPSPGYVPNLPFPGHLTTNVALPAYGAPPGRPINAFPYHPYVRSPRDFFMWRENMEDQARRDMRPSLVP